jgi:hypothetical protein
MPPFSSITHPSRFIHADSAGAHAIKQTVPAADTPDSADTAGLFPPAASTGAVSISVPRAQGVDVQMGLAHCSHGLYGRGAAPHRCADLETLYSLLTCMAWTNRAHTVGAKGQYCIMRHQAQCVGGGWGTQGLESSMTGSASALRH